MALTLEMDSDAFVRLLTDGQRRLYGYIRTIVLDQNFTSEILAQTNAVLWEKRAEFQLGTDFVAWALRVAYFEVLAFQKKRRTDRHIFDGELLDEIADVAIEASREMSEKQSALASCIEKLNPIDRQLLSMRYQAEMSIDDMARQRGKSSNAMAQAMFRIRTALTQCIERALRSEAST